MTAHRTILAVALSLLGAATPARAQQASITANAQVSVIALSIAGTQNLDFGAVPQGVPTAVSPRTSLNAGRFIIHGFPFAQFQLTFTLPPALLRFPGPAIMPITFGANSACGLTTNVQANCAFFNPATPLTTRIRLALWPNNTYFVWLGATVTPGVAQAGGIYQGTVTATVAYTGN
jgi:hypothetical protein